MAYDQRGAGRGYGKPNGEKKSYGERSYADKPYDKKRYSRRWAVDGLLRIFAPLC